MSFITENFLLQSKTAQRLYHTYAADQPIFDYHCHLPVRELAENRRFADLFEIWLEGDHYKWRAMRANGVDERFCTGSVAPYEKFLAWARTVPYTLRNPLYHWTHLELERYFGITDLLDETTAPAIWKKANAMLAGELAVHDILRKFRVAVVCTTDDPIDNLEYHAQLADSDLLTRVYPAFRPDRALRVDEPGEFNPYVEKLEASANVFIRRFSDFLEALERRHDFFHTRGCRLSDHGLNTAFSEPCTEAQAAAIFTKVRGGSAADPAEAVRFASFLMLFFGRLDARKGWTKQLHLGAFRNVNTRMRRQLGRDTGFDCIGDWPQAESLARYIDALDSDNSLPRLVIYNLNPADNYVFSTMIGNFQDGTIPGKLQFGSGWWFLDQKEAIEWQLNALSNTGLLSRFVGMLTDSRSFMSFPRHEYFRRVLCNLLGNEMERGELPNDEKMVGRMVSDICYSNASNYFAMGAGDEADKNGVPVGTKRA